MIKRTWQSIAGLICFLICSLALASDIAGLPQNPYPFTSSTDANRFESLTKEIRCVVCQNQNIADSNAPLANDLRTKVYELIKNQKSDVEIKEYLVKRYGEFILLRPRFNQTTALLWIFPFVALGFIFIFLVRFVNART